LYPCGSCAKNFRGFIEQTDFDQALESRADLAKWLCEAHNDVNRKNSKAEFDCTSVLDFWPTKLKNQCSCEDEPEKDPNSDSYTDAEVGDPNAAAAATALAPAVATDSGGAANTAEPSHPAAFVIPAGPPKISLKRRSGSVSVLGATDATVRRSTRAGVLPEEARLSA